MNGKTPEIKIIHLGPVNYSTGFRIIMKNVCWYPLLFHDFRNIVTLVTVQARFLKTSINLTKG